MFTGTLIEDLIATVERVEKTHPEAILPPDLLIADAWLASIERNHTCNSNLLGVA